MEGVKEKQIKLQNNLKGNLLLRRKVSIAKGALGVCRRTGIQYATRLSCVAVEQRRLREAEQLRATSRQPHLACCQFVLALGAGGYVTFSSRVTRSTAHAHPPSPTPSRNPELIQAHVAYL
ncbi:hypothetical protein E2C01_075698 [Portunus trituberculatus]|uniref:Uncharacterized protein n=1 Tax=Portunus trituberculatus TaxID=210409 RepID=A0A5B7IGG3_PORTR|nr:hypothetical protein [Portunus trituberculatus]